MAGALFGVITRNIYRRPVANNGLPADNLTMECARLQRHYHVWSKVTAVAAVSSIPAIIADIALQDHAQEAPTLTPERLLALSAVGIVSLGGVLSIFRAQNAHDQYMLRCAGMSRAPRASTQAATSDTHEFQEIAGGVDLPEIANPTAVSLAHQVWSPSGHPHQIDWHAAGQAALIVGGAALVVAAVVATDGAALVIIPAL